MLDKEIEWIINQNPRLTVKQFIYQTGIKIRTFYRYWSDESTPKELLERKRLEIAKHYLLSHCNQKIEEIARNLHFCDQHYFCKWFRRKVGISPLRYRATTLKERINLERERFGLNSQKKIHKI